MNEDFIHYLWKYKKFEWTQLQTTAKEKVALHHVGVHNTEHSGPDFFNAQLTIGTQKWAGTVELHLKASDWYAHHHETDPAYDNVILHVVWEEDVVVFRKDNTPLPTLQLETYVSKSLLTTYQELFKHSSNTWLYCEKDIGTISNFMIQHWKERVYVERLAQKGKEIEALLIAESNDWEAVLFQLLAKNFGLNVNQDAFLSMANAIDFGVVRKCSANTIQLEALFFGQAGLITGKEEAGYAKTLWKEYLFLKHKFNLDAQGVLPFQFFRLRPPNFPTIRLSQLVQVYATHQQLFAKVITVDSLEACYALFSVETTAFWKTHYTFDKTSSSRTKKLTASFIDLIVINTIIPLQFMHAKMNGMPKAESMFAFIRQVPRERNSTIQRYEKHGVSVTSALDTQALLQLKKQYCEQKRCLECAIGNQILQRNKG